jgi:hypothetical protein
MATVQINGSSAVTGTYWSGTSTKNNHGVAVNTGSYSSILSSRSVANSPTTVFGSTVVPASSTVNDYADKALSGGTFRYNNQRPLAVRLTSTISGVSNTVLRSGALVPSLVTSINRSRVKNGSNVLVDGVRTRRDTTAIRAGNFNFYTGKFSVAPTVAADTYTTDSAATVGRSAPGQLVFRTGSKVPVTKNYPAKTA